MVALFPAKLKLYKKTRVIASLAHISIAHIQAVFS